MINTGLLSMLSSNTIYITQVKNTFKTLDTPIVLKNLINLELVSR